MAENKSVVGYGGEKSSDAESKLSRCETRVAGAVSDDPTDGAPWRWRIIAMLFGLSMGAGSIFSKATLGPLKSTLVKKLHISSESEYRVRLSGAESRLDARYGTIFSATSVVNMFLPVIGGYLVDFYPVEYSMLFCAFTVFAGAVVSAVGAQRQSFGPVLAGRLLMGFGSAIIEIIPQKIYYHWFRGRGLAFVFGLDISWGKVIVLIAKAGAVPMTSIRGEWSWALWVPAIICGVNVVLTFGYMVWIRTLPQQVRMGGWMVEILEKVNRYAIVSAQERARSQLRRPTLKAAKEIPSFFWFMFCTQSQICQAGVVGAFTGLSADIIRATRGTTAQVAGYQGERGDLARGLCRRRAGSVQQVIPIVFAPFLGAFFDRYGRRMLFISITACIWIAVFAVLGYSRVHALFPMVLSSVALVVGSVDQIGTGYGLYKAFNNAGSVIIDVAAGAIQDTTRGGGYNGVIGFFIAFKGMEIVWGLVYGVLDRRLLRGVLWMSERARHEMEKQVDLGAEPGRRPHKGWTYGGWQLNRGMVKHAAHIASEGSQLRIWLCAHVTGKWAGHVAGGPCGLRHSDWLKTMTCGSVASSPPGRPVTCASDVSMPPKSSQNPSPPPTDRDRPSRASSSATDLSSLPSPRSPSPTHRPPTPPSDTTDKARPPARPVVRNTFDLEPNPFEQSFSRSGNSVHTLAGTRSPGRRSPAPSGTTLPPPVGNGPETPKPILPPLASLSSPGGPNAFGHWGLGGGALSGSLRSGPLSPALLNGPKEQSTRVANGTGVGGWDPSHPAFRTGLTPDVGRTGLTPLVGGPVSFPPPSPNTAAFLAMVTNHTSGVSGGMTVGGALSGDMVPGSSATITPGTLTALVNSMSQTANNQSQPHPLSMSHLPGRFGQNNAQQSDQRNQSQFPPASYQNGSDPYHGAAQNAAAAAANGLFLLSQAHQELTKREEAAQAANHTAGPKRNNSLSSGHNKRKSTDSGPSKPTHKKTRSAHSNSKRGHHSDDDGEGSIDGDPDDSEVEGEAYEPEASKPLHKPKKAETEEEKRKNFLERNRQAALKCRQRKKAWLTQLQAKVEYLTAENDRLTSTLTGKFFPAPQLSAIVVAHRDCGLGGVALGTQLTHGATGNINNGQPGAPVSIPVSVPQAGASSVAAVPVGAVAGSRTRSGYGY
ncbi:Transcription factor atf1 [Ceratobasidium theobromae]|uniref:Lysosomal dipeptide transporter MFSD1 n=1 Tax=Ceratobasidium theobromae TaxID=1582974 RepID=A0A5N5QS06_9AGAM|nr:Transcription factor atf1 [Ceratobasidium theobromae]